MTKNVKNVLFFVTDVGKLDCFLKQILTSLSITCELGHIMRHKKVLHIVALYPYSQTLNLPRKKIDRNTDASLFCSTVHDEEKSFLVLTPGCLYRVQKPVHCFL